jgi:hypothetical protein
MYLRIVNSIKFGWWAYKNPRTLNSSIFKMLSDLLELILKVAREEKHYMSHIAYIHPEDKELKEIVSIWAGAGIGATPTKRIAELIEENSKLKFQLSQYIKENKETEDRHKI